MATKSKKAYLLLYEELVKNNIEPGTFLDEQELVKQFNLGRTPIREAVKQLAIEGLLEVLPRKGILVKPVTTEYLRDILETRSYLEPHVAGLAAQRISSEEIIRMWQLHAEFASMLKEENHWKLSCLDKKLHQAVANAARNKVMIEVLDRLSTNMQRIWMYTHQLDPHRKKRLSMPSQWETLINHISKGEVEEARAAMYLHITYGQQDVVQDK